ncbi:hypothetical protein D1007_35190 [Hordeum vulgare]|nr:hypothetical protein D1007_35190 [Hordeum vulgare]
MRIVVPVASIAATSVTSPRGDEDPMEQDTTDMATSQRVIHLEDDEELRRTTAELAKTMPETLVTSAPPTGSIVVTTASPASSVVVTTVPTTPLPITPVTSAAMPTPLMLAYPSHRVPEDHTGVAKDAMIQAEQMMLQIKVAYEASKLAYDASSVLQANVRKTCEIGVKYANLESEKNHLQLDLEVTTNDLNVLKKALTDKDKALTEAKEKFEAVEEKLLAVG